MVQGYEPERRYFYKIYERVDYVEQHESNGEGFSVPLVVRTFCKNLLVNPEVFLFTYSILLFSLIFSLTNLLYFSTISVKNPLSMDPILVCRHTFSKYSVICGLVTFFSLINAPNSINVGILLKENRTQYSLPSFTKAKLNKQVIAIKWQKVFFSEMGMFLNK